jgi:hypothetical protein
MFPNESSHRLWLHADGSPVVKHLHLGIGQQQNKFIAAITGCDIRLAGCFLDRFSGQFLMLHRRSSVKNDVYGFVMIQVRHNQAVITMIPSGTCEFTLQGIKKFSSISQTGQRVGDGETAQFFFHVLAVGDVMQQ